MNFTPENELICYFLCLLLESVQNILVSAPGVHIPTIYATVWLKYRISSVPSIILTAKAMELMM